MPLLKVGGQMFTVNGKTWDIDFVEPTNDNLMRSDKVYTLGVTDNNIKTIFLSNKLYGEMLDKVLCHELVHAFSFEYNYDIDIKTEEIIADFMSLFGRDIIYLLDDLIDILKKSLGGFIAN